SVGTLPLAFTDSNGSASLAGLPAGEIRVIARRDGYAPSYSDTTFVSPGTDAEFAVVLPRGVRVFAAVLDADGKRYPDATVSVRRDGGPWISGGLLHIEPRRDGTIDLGRLEPGPWQFSIEHPILGSTTVETTVESASPQTVELRVRR
ncbi:MAG: carboxypeptidase regulatory-like domain-containing protein, partial [Planctomycetes bacterium]|nr:carboxypeptidase regulatory-like domain-containing protein [Planctomycetota bacterium]